MTIARRAALAALLATPALTAATRAHAQGAEIGTAARPLKMGVTAGPHAQVMERVRDIAAKDGLVIRIIEFTDYIQPDRQTDQKQVDANYFQTKPYYASYKKSNPSSDQVPVVVAKGRGVTALAIRELAKETKLPILEYPALARAVYYTSKEGQEVRDDLYLAIATVLAWVFRLNHEAGGSPPPIDVPESAWFDENGVHTGKTAKAGAAAAVPTGSGR